MTRTGVQLGANEPNIPVVLSWNAGKCNNRDDYLLPYLSGRAIPEIIAIQETGRSSPKILKQSHKVTECGDLLVYHTPRFKNSIIQNASSHQSFFSKILIVQYFECTSEMGLRAQV